MKNKLSLVHYVLIALFLYGIATTFVITKAAPVLEDVRVNSDVYQAAKAKKAEAVDTVKTNILSKN